ncbi:HlyD family secretion protein [Thalassovita taeanensis]|uniref:HlyD family secretion protein n=1 Tax=Thalassovita taeanensis TaxID=657014 RepID=A0A1H9CCQ7_9RHOB|nr:HlyD family efflux transporter periplasmic adaptor subunit [Thalassovita taeanensis]SEP98583.1 HlyD family secretion protein [Thalassovita taeanensis]
MNFKTVKRAMPLVIIVAAIGGFFLWDSLKADGVPAGFAAGNGRIEAVEIDIAAKTPGRIAKIMVDEGDFVVAGQVLARVDTTQLEVTLRQAEAQKAQAEISVETAKITILQREAEKRAAEATLAQRQATLDMVEKQLERSQKLAASNARSEQVLDSDRAAALGAKAAFSAGEAGLAASEAAIQSAKAMVVQAEAAVMATQAAIDSIKVQIDDSTLVAPRDGRVQYLVAQEGEIVGAGGRIINLVDLGDVYMTFFLPTSQAGQIGIGTDVRIVLDAAPGITVPAKVSFVSDVAQFTPKTVETEIEREKLMFRIKAQIDKALLQEYIQQVKTGLPGMAYVRMDPQAPWPADLEAALIK